MKSAALVCLSLSQLVACVVSIREHVWYTAWITQAPPTNLAPLAAKKPLWSRAICIDCLSLDQRAILQCTRGSLCTT